MQRRMCFTIYRHATNSHSQMIHALPQTRRRSQSDFCRLFNHSTTQEISRTRENFSKEVCEKYPSCGMTRYKRKKQVETNQFFIRIHSRPHHCPIPRPCTLPFHPIVRRASSTFVRLHRVVWSTKYNTCLANQYTVLFTQTCSIAAREAPWGTMESVFSMSRKVRLSVDRYERMEDLKSIVNLNQN